MALSRNKLAEYASSPSAWRADMNLDSEPPRPYRELAELWQERDFLAMDPAWLSLAGRQVDVKHRRAYLERPRGHSKTSDLALSALWALAFSQRSLTGIAAAGDLDQARLLRDSMHKLARLNDWLLDLLDFTRNEIENKHTGSKLTILSADVGTSWGLKPDFLIVDEITAWPNPELWHSLFSSAAKRPKCLLIGIANAGCGKEWQWELRELARQDKSWYFHSLAGPQAKWISAENLAEQQRLLPPSVFARLWLNQWCDSGGDFLTYAECLACRDDSLSYGEAGKLGIGYVAAIDYGEKRDSTVCSVVHREGELVILDRMDVWTPRPNEPIPVATVEAWMAEVEDKFHHPLFIIDPWQLSGTYQRFEQQNFNLQRWQATAKTQGDLAQTLRNLIVNRRILWYSSATGGPGAVGQEDLERELSSLVVRPTPTGWRFDHTSARHDDRAMSLGMAAVTVLSEPDDEGPEVAEPEVLTRRTYCPYTPATWH